MLNFGIGELLFIALIALVIVGPERLPLMVRFLGRQYGKLMRASRELRRAFVMEAERVESEIRAKEMKTKREEARERLTKQLEKAKAGAPTPISQEEEEEEGEESEYVPFDSMPHQNTTPQKPESPDETEDTDVPQQEQ